MLNYAINNKRVLLEHSVYNTHWYLHTLADTYLY